MKKLCKGISFALATIFFCRGRYTPAPHASVRNKLIGGRLSPFLPATALLLISMLATTNFARTEVYEVQKLEKDIKDKDAQIEQQRNNLNSESATLNSHWSLLKNELTDVNAQMDSANARVNSWNSRCAGRPSNGACASESASVDGQMGAAKERVKSWNEKKDKHLGAVEKHNAVLDQWKGLFKQREALVKQLEVARTNQRMSCNDTSRMTPEELKNKCGNVQFDGASAGLQACVTEKCLRFEKMREK